jgi:hypothetical protein
MAAIEERPSLNVLISLFWGAEETALRRNLVVVVLLR